LTTIPALLVEGDTLPLEKPKAAKKKAKATTKKTKSKRTAVASAK
jgi:hypothetical protein